MISTVHPNPSPKTLLLTAGAFGAAVAEKISLTDQVTVESLLDFSDQLPNVITDYDYIAVVSWRPYINLYQKIDELCFEHNIRWSVTDLSGQLLRCGPLVIPGHGACYHCFYQRISCHRTAVERENVVEAYLERDPTLGVEGFVQPMVNIAATALLENGRADQAQASSFRFIDVLASSVRISKVIGIHNCSRCRPKPEGFDQKDRFIESMVPTLEEILD